jgi:hypothetical protein
MKQPENKKKRNKSELSKRNMNHIRFMFLPGRHVTVGVGQTGG